MMERTQYHIMTDDSKSQDIFTTLSFPTISDYDDLEQNADGHITLKRNRNVSAFSLS